MPSTATEHRDGARWLSVKNGLASRLGPNVVRSWFDNIEVAAFTDRELVLQAPNKHHRIYVEAHYLGALLDAARVCMPTLDRVRLVSSAR